MQCLKNEHKHKLVLRMHGTVVGADVSTFIGGLEIQLLEPQGRVVSLPLLALVPSRGVAQALPHQHHPY